MVVGLPNNLSPFVEAGVMVGAGSGPAEIRRALLDVLDGTAAVEARQRIHAFTQHYHLHADGQAAPRAARVITRA